MKKIMSVLLLLSLLFLSGCATPGAIEQDSKVAWNGTKKVSGEVWEDTKDASGKAWEGTKEVSGEAWDGTKRAVNNITAD